MKTCTHENTIDVGDSDHMDIYCTDCGKGEMTDKEQELLHDVKGTGVSKCCGAGTYGDYKICEACGEHC